MGRRGGTSLVLTSVAAAALLLGCTKEQPPAPLSVTPTFQAKPPSAAASTEPLILSGQARRATVIQTGPAPPANQVRGAAPPQSAAPPLPDGAEAEALALEQVSLPMFINEVFAKTLKLTVQMDPSVSSRTDLVTLRTGRALPANELFVMAERILAGYGLAVTWDGSVVHVMPDTALMAQMPELIHSRALPEMPVAMRPIFQIIDLHQVSANDMMSWLSNAYGTKLKIFPSPKTNAILLFGLPQDVRAAVEAVRVLDEARLAGRRSMRFSPVYWTSQRLAAKLVEILHAEGYDAGASTGAANNMATAVTLVPVEANNSMIAFAADGKILQHVAKWVTDLDQPGQADPARNIFVYMVQNTTAASLGRTVQNVLGGRTTVGTPTEAQLERAGSTQQLPTVGQNQPAKPAAATAPQPAVDQTTPSAPGQATTPRIVVDEPRNALVLVGTAQDYDHIRPLLLALDKAPREALVEVTVVELDLSDSAAAGLDWTLNNHIGGGLTQRLGTGANVLSPPGSLSTTTTGTTGLLGSTSSGTTTGTTGASNGIVGLPLGTTGFNYTILNGIGDVRLAINAVAQNNRISVLSTPRILAESGGTANIEVGTEVPIVTSQGTTNTIQNAGTSGILQSIEYRKTGILLKVSPVIHSGDHVDLAVSQEVSQALPNSTPGISSPLIQNRNVSTQLSLTDGQTLVIGGLISENRTSTDSGVPYLKDIPGLGLLFRSQSVGKDRTELLVFITPYVISDAADATAITHQFQDQLRTWQLPNTNLHW
ncbi:MAG TPA: secretin N-terminal domain-containing protein [Stellaceae bacterium]|nr:secretin N-terminal domain-containing protein [Stellaceae bacterium]